jgi:hypothetical protein
VNAVMNLKVSQNAGNFLTGWGSVSFSGRTLPHDVSTSTAQTCFFLLLLLASFSSDITRLAAAPVKSCSSDGYSTVALSPRCTTTLRFPWHLPKQSRAGNFKLVVMRKSPKQARASWSHRVPCLFERMSQ